MIDRVKALVHLLRGGAWWWGLAISLVLLVGSLVLIAVVVTGWSADHFQRPGGAPFWEHRHPIVRAGGLFGKNVAGVLLVLLGVVMALPGVPGQGLLTMLIGLTLVDFPGKRRVERRLVGRPMVFKALNRLRARFKKPPLELAADPV